jgi:uncharacterized protein YeeX (DUF496 family)
MLKMDDLIKAAGEIGDVVEEDPALLDDDSEWQDEPEEPTPPTVAEETVETPNEDISQSEAAPAPEVAADEEWIFISDDAGRKKLKVDYKDKEGTKKAYKLAAGYSKMKTERDNLLVKSRDLDKSLSDLKEFKKVLDDTWTKEGIAGIYSRVRGEDAPEWDDYILQEAVRIQNYRNASPEQKKALEDSRELQKLKTEQQAWVKQQEDLRTSAEQAREAAELEKFTALITPHFEKVRFNEIADSAKAERMDARLWREAKEEFKRLESEGKDITPAVAARVFKDIADDIRSLISTKVSEQVSEEIDKKKKAAQTKMVQATDKAGKAAGKDESFADDVAKLGGLAAFNKLFGRR